MPATHFQAVQWLSGYIAALAAGGGRCLWERSSPEI